MPELGPRLRRRPPLPRSHRPGLILLAVAGLLAALYFHYATSSGTPTNASSPAVDTSAPTEKPPLIRFLLGADLWCLFDASLQDAGNRPYPQFAIDLLRSRNAVDKGPVPYQHEMLLVLPAEKFLADEFARREATIPGLTVQSGPDVWQTHLVLLMSPKTRTALTSPGMPEPATLLDWLRACQATETKGAPVRFEMADPNTCSSSWLGIADMLSDAIHSDARHLGDVSPGELASTLANIRRHLVIEGNSDRIEMYRYLLSGCPDNRVLLVYGHLADLISSDKNFTGYTIVTPRLQFQPVVRAIVLTWNGDHINIGDYLQPLLQQFAATSLLPSTQKLLADQPSESNALVPDYATMIRLLDAWNGTTKN